MSKNSKVVEELLDDIGQDSEEKGAKATISYHKRLQKEDKEKKDLFLNKLDSIKKKETYYRVVWEEARLRSLEFSVPKGFQWKFGISPDGLALYIYDGKHTYAQGMKVTGEPASDAKGIEALLSMGLDYMEVLNSQWKTK